MIPNNLKVFFYLKPVDMRKSINGLSIMVVDQLEMDAMSGQLFLFCNRYKDKIKALYWDKNGFCLWYKRLEKGRFKIPDKYADHLEISMQELSYLLDGVDIKNINKSNVIFCQNTILLYWSTHLNREAKATVFLKEKA